MISFGLGKNKRQDYTIRNAYIVLAPNAKDTFYIQLGMWGGIWFIMKEILDLEFG